MVAGVFSLALAFGAAYPKTKYAPRFTRAGFKGVKVGMTTDEVRKIVGDPLFVHGGQLSEDTWEYSLDDCGGFLDLGWRATTVYSLGGVVTAKNECFVWRMPWEKPN